MNIRALAAKVIFQVLKEGESLSVALPYQQEQIKGKDLGLDKGLLAELCYGVLRNLPQLENKITTQMEKPFKNNKLIIHHLLLVGCYQIYFTRIPEHAAISETVEACKQLGSSSLGGVVNGVLRNILRNKTPLSEEYGELRYNLPKWLLRKLKDSYPERWITIAENSNEKPPMWIRNNILKQSKEDYIKKLNELNILIEKDNFPSSSNAILLKKAVDVSKLPDFDTGASSVQDAAAQWAAILLDPKPGELILDLCAAPGGKSCHLFEKEPNIKLVSVDIDNNRVNTLKENFKRLSVKGETIVGDALEIDKWWNNGLFDKILLDAPCSATGVIRRHPDIKWLRKKEDINQLATLQAQILAESWKWLKPGGTLLYATCSILPLENKLQISNFLRKNEDASLINMPDEVYEYLDLIPGLNQDFLYFESLIGWQILPGNDDMDGFYYALIKKASS